MSTIDEHVAFQPRGEGWQGMPEFPSSDEILQPTSLFRTSGLENRVNQPWANKQDYLELQWKLLRCEGVEGLRFSVNAYIRLLAEQGGQIHDDGFTCIYTEVFIKGYLLSNGGPIFRVSFSTKASKFAIDWLQSKRLQSGSLVAISTAKDRFRTICKVATVAQRPYLDGLDQNPPLVDLMWARPDDAIFDPAEELIIIESRHGYFEAVRHALVGLQHAANTDSDLEKYLLGHSTADKMPNHIKESPDIDLTSIIHLPPPEIDQGTRARLANYNVGDGALREEELKGVTTLNQSQLDGIRRILTSELAIIQGPPGTGKTFTSVEALKILVKNQRSLSQKGRCPPILISAQTNHALDQILIHCLDFGAKVLRVGGRTENPLITQHTLYETFSRSRRSQTDFYKGLKGPKNQMQENGDHLQALFETALGGELLDIDVLLEHKIITDDQHASLISLETNPSDLNQGNGSGDLSIWLGSDRIPASLTHITEHENVLETDGLALAEYEIDGDLEETADVEDVDQEHRLKGRWIPVQQGWTGRISDSHTNWRHKAESELRNKSNFFAIEPEHRGGVYRLMQRKLVTAFTKEFRALLSKNLDICKQLKRVRFRRDVKLVDYENIEIVGCTTTGLSKYRGILAALNPVTLLIEEAAETCEANITSAIYPTLQQLILVGDHQQLAPNCSIRWLANAPFHIDLSLFERMVNLKMNYVMLDQQRRMAPELRHILIPFYPRLKDHPLMSDLSKRPLIPGMGDNRCWFFDHSWPEATNVDHSKYNMEEAQMIVYFFTYLFNNGVPAKSITVLTFYTGQRKLLLNKLRKHPTLIGQTFNVKTVDSYQGEENDIILLSLVRSPRADRRYAIGFLEDQRRAIVAISRARMGFFVFGNVENFLNCTDEGLAVWGRIWNGFAAQNRTNRGRGVPLTCRNHSRVTWIKELEDWGDNAGGCNWPCGGTRDCGHPCTMKCHSLAHKYLMCDKACTQLLPCGHRCHNVCGQKCYCRCQGLSLPLDTGYGLEFTEPAPVSLAQTLMDAGAQESSLVTAELAAKQLTSTTLSTTTKPNNPPPVFQQQNSRYENQVGSARGNSGGRNSNNAGVRGGRGTRGVRSPRGNRRNAQGSRQSGRNQVSHTATPSQARRTQPQLRGGSSGTLQAEVKSLTEQQARENPWAGFQSGPAAKSQGRVGDLMSGDALNFEKAPETTDGVTPDVHTFQLTEVYRPTTMVGGLRVSTGPAQRRESSQSVGVTAPSLETTKFDAENAKFNKAFADLKMSGALNRYGIPSTRASPPKVSQSQVLAETWVDECAGAGWVRAGVNTPFVPIGEQEPVKKSTSTPASRPVTKKAEPAASDRSRTPSPPAPAVWTPARTSANQSPVPKVTVTAPEDCPVIRHPTSRLLEAHPSFQTPFWFDGTASPPPAPTQARQHSTAQVAVAPLSNLSLIDITTTAPVPSIRPPPGFEHVSRQLTSEIPLPPGLGFSLLDTPSEPSMAGFVSDYVGVHDLLALSPKKQARQEQNASFVQDENKDLIEF